MSENNIKFSFTNKRKLIYDFPIFEMQKLPDVQYSYRALQWL